MEIKKYSDYVDFTYDVLDSFNNIENGEICIIAKYYDAVKMIQELVRYDCEIFDIEIHNIDINDYKNEYYIILNDTGVSCCKACDEYGYFKNYADITYVFDDCNSRVLKRIKSNKIYEVSLLAERNNEDIITKAIKRIIKKL